MTEINFFKWQETPEATRQKLMRRAQADIESVASVVRPVIEDVRDHGDDALRRYAQKFDGADLKTIKATPDEFARAEKTLDENLKTAIKKCADNVRKFHDEQMRRVEKYWMVDIEPGVRAGEQVSPIESVGLYVPRGKGAFPSTMYMLCIPAVIAGVQNIAVVTPPRADGSADDASLYTAKLCGVENVYKVGGAQAIAALAYGTETVPRVRKVLGPGSPYVQAAKQLLFGILDPGMPASSSEAVILCDETADQHNTCLDMLNEAEHGKDSAVLLITHDEKLANFVRDNLSRFIDELPEPHRGICAHVMQNYGGIILTETLDESIALSNEYAPEHLHLKVKNAEKILPRLEHAGEILIGEYAPSTLGNYGTGVNHVLPTGGFAHTYSCTTVWDFLKRTSLSEVTKQGFESLIGPVTTLTDYEGFPAHGDALRKRKI
jgi:histidinol dehydrogenase